MTLYASEDSQAPGASDVLCDKSPRQRKVLNTKLDKKNRTLILVWAAFAADFLVTLSGWIDIQQLHWKQICKEKSSAPITDAAKLFLGQANTEGLD